MITQIAVFAKGQLLAIKRSSLGAAAVEFALVGPLFIALFIGVLQVGIYLQNYNAVQSIASDGARHVMIEYQKDNSLSDEQIRSVILAQAINAPYLLDSDRLEIFVDRTGASRVTGATEIRIEIRYMLFNFIPGIEIPGSLIVYQRPAFVVV